MSSTESSNIFLLLGTEQVRISLEIEEISKLLKIESSSFNQINLSKQTKLNLDDLKEKLNSISLFAKNNYWLIRNVDELTSAEDKNLAQLLKTSGSSNYIILTAESLSKKSPTRCLCEENGKLVVLEPLEGQLLINWIKDRLSLRFKKVDQKIIAELTKDPNTNLDEITRKLELLSLATNSEELKISDYLDLFPQYSAINEFEFVDTILNNNILALSQIPKLLDQGSNPFGLLALIQRNFAQLIQIAQLSSNGKSALEISRETAIPEWLVKKKLPILKKIKVTKLKDSLNLILMADLKLKNKNLGNRIVLEELIQGLAC